MCLCVFSLPVSLIACAVLYIIDASRDGLLNRSARVRNKLAAERFVMRVALVVCCPAAPTPGTLRIEHFYH